jgi:hypothetical protein
MKEDAKLFFTAEVAKCFGDYANLKPDLIALGRENWGRLIGLLCLPPNQLFVTVLLFL